jgi:hypothetical protein
MRPEDKLKIEQMKMEQKGEILLKNCTVEEARLILAIEGPLSPVFTSNSTKNLIVYDFGFRAVKFEYYWISLSFLISDGQFLFAFIYFVLSM